MSNIDPAKLTNILTLTFILLLLILISLLGIFFFLKFYGKYKRTSKEKGTRNLGENNQETKSDVKQITKSYTKDSIEDFLEFDTIEDNMIVQKDHMRYLMAVECQGINYDLMSNAEKVAVEEGFLQFLNTLRHPIQIYIQTRTVNLSDSIEQYSKKVNEIKNKLEAMRENYLSKKASISYSTEEEERDLYEITKQTNLYEYAKDILRDTERTSLNKNILSKKYYIIIPCYPADIETGKFDKEELKNLAFSELYTKAQSVIRTLAACDVIGRIMNSEDLVDLLYVAYNRDESEIYGIDKAMRAGFYELYTTAPDVMDKKMRELRRRVEQQALTLANEKVVQAKTEKQKQVEELQEQFEETVTQRASQILTENEQYLGKKLTKRAKELVEQKGGEEDDKKQVSTTRRKKQATKK